jgi:trimethylamine:corrinoid methyltransferase-like protein
MQEKRVHLNIPVASFQAVLSWDKRTIDALVDKAIDLAVKVGLRLEQDGDGKYLKEAQSKGARPDWDAHAAMFTRAQVEQTIEVMRKTLPAPDPLRPPKRAPRGRDEKFFVGDGSNLMFDWDRWTVKAPEVKDIVWLCRWAQGCPDVENFFPPCMLKDIDQRLAPLYNYALMSKYCRKNVWHEQPTEPIHVRYLDRMARVYEQHRGFFHPVQEWEYINPPFRIGRRSVEAMLERVDTGVCKEMGIGPMSVGGMSSPVTVAGMAVTALAETLAGLTLFRILRQGFGLKSVVCTGSLDLRTARVSYFNMHTHLGNLATWELIVRGIGANAPSLTWYRDANEPGMQALYEFGMAQAFFSSIMDYAGEIGGLCNGNIFSPHQAVMDMAAVKEFNELLYGFEADTDDLGLEEVASARFEQGVQMSTEHTLSHKMDGVPFSDYLFRGLSAGAQHDKGHTQTQELLEKANNTVEEQVAQGLQTAPDEKLADELHKLVKEAAAELGIDAPPLI